MPENTAIQFANPDVLQHCQDEGLRDTLLYISQYSPFYKKHFALHGIRVKDIASISQLNQLSFTTKDDLQRENDSFLCVPRHKVREYVSTSGTTGKPVSIALTEGDLKRLALNESQSFQIMGSKTGDICQIAVTLDRQFMAGIAYYSGIQKLGATVIRTGPGHPAQQWENIVRYNVDTLICVPSFLLKMAVWAQENQIDLTDVPLRKAICIGESIREIGLSLNNMGRNLYNKLPMSLLSTYASTEMQTAFSECSAGMGGHHQPDLILVEIIDHNNLQVQAGEPGEVVITTIGVEGMPLLRYKTGDICTWYDTPCNCGRNTKRLGPIIGRKQQMIKYKGTTLYPQAFFNALSDIDYVTDYVIEALTMPTGNDEVIIHINTPFSEVDCTLLLTQLLQAKLRVTPTIKYASIVEITALQQAGEPRKQSKFIDRRIA